MKMLCLRDQIHEFELSSPDLNNWSILIDIKQWVEPCNVNPSVLNNSWVEESDLFVINTTAGLMPRTLLLFQFLFLCRQRDTIYVNYWGNANFKQSTSIPSWICCTKSKWKCANSTMWSRCKCTQAAYNNHIHFCIEWAWCAYATVKRIRNALCNASTPRSASLISDVFRIGIIGILSLIRLSACRLTSHPCVIVNTVFRSSLLRTASFAAYNIVLRTGTLYPITNSAMWRQLLLLIDGSTKMQTKPW